MGFELGELGGRADDCGDRDRLDFEWGFIAPAEREEALHDPVNALRFMDDDAETFRGILRTRVAREVLRHHQNSGQRVADFVCDARGQRPDRGETILVRYVSLELAKSGDVFHDEDAPLFASSRDRRGLGTEIDVPITEVVFALDDRAGWLMRELVEQRPPRAWNVVYRISAYLVFRKPDMRASCAFQTTTSSCSSTVQTPTGSSDISCER